ncbi:MAG: diguanylate cyclase [Pseudomonadota bacterium]
MLKLPTRLLDTRNRTLLVNMGVVVLLSLIFVLALLNLHRSRVKESIQQFDQSLQRIAQQDVSDLLDFFENRARANLATPGIREAMRARDHDAILTLSSGRFEVLQRETPELGVMHFHAADGSSLGRMHYPGHWGDPISASRPMLARVQQSHVPAKGMELGRFGLFLRVVLPAFIDEEYVGALEFGVTPQLILRRIRDELGAESLLLIDPEAARQLAPDLFDPHALSCQGMRHRLCLADSKLPLPHDFTPAAESTLVQFNGRNHILHTNITLNDHEGRRVAMLVVAQDITHLLKRFQGMMGLILVAALLALVAVFFFLRHTLIRMERELATGQARLEAIASSMSEGMYMLDTEGRLVFINPAALQMLGYREDELLGRNLHDVIHHTDRHGDHVAAENCPINQAIHRKEPCDADNDIFWRKDGRAMRVAYAASPVVIDGKVAGSVAIFRDNHDRLEREEALAMAQEQAEELNRQLQVQIEEVTRASETDPLTGIANRAKFNMVLQREYDRARRYGTPLSLVLLDIDHFKQINDTQGHLSGDEVLRELTRLIRHNLRSSDHFARWGGEEFVILSPESAPLALELAEKLRKLIAEHHFEPVGSVTCSFGVTQCNDNDTLDLCLTRADEALYRAKAHGRNRVECH